MAALALDSWVQLATGSLALVTASLAAGFLAGIWFSFRRIAGSVSGSRRRRRDELCECGVVLPRSLTAEEKARHKISNRHRKNMQTLGNLSEVIVCEEVGEYRQCVKHLVKPDDWVLEVGSHVGGTTQVIASCTKNLVGIDQQPDLVAQARTKLPHIRFENLDAFDASKVLEVVRSIAPARFSKVFIDISGSRDISTVVRLMDSFENIVKPAYMIVKSQPLKRLLLRGELWINHEAQMADAA